MNATGTLHQRARYLEGKAGEIRAEILKMIHSAQSGHPGGSLSAADIMAALYFDILNIRPDEPEWTERDRFVLSKGTCLSRMVCHLGTPGIFSRR
jgi:transketolase